MTMCIFTHGYSHPLVLVQTSSWEPYLENRKGQVWQLLLPDLEGRTVLKHEPGFWSTILFPRLKLLENCGFVKEINHNKANVKFLMVEKRSLLVSKGNKKERIISPH